MSQIPSPPLDAATLLGFVSAGSPLRVRTHAREEVSVVEKTATIQTLASIRHEISARRDWKTPIAISATIGAVIPLTDWSWAGERWGISASGWMNIFIGAAVLTLLGACVLAWRNRIRPPLSPEDIYERIAGNEITELAAPLSDSDRPESRVGLGVGAFVRHKRWGIGEVVATRRSGGTEYMTIRFAGPPDHQEEVIAELTSLLRVLPGDQ